MKMNKIELRFNEYIGHFYRADKRGRMRKFFTMGNTGIAIDVAQMLEKLGHKVEYFDQSEQGETKSAMQTQILQGLQRPVKTKRGVTM